MRRAQTIIAWMVMALAHEESAAAAEPGDILRTSTTRDGRMQLEIASTPNHYFVVYRSRDITFAASLPVGRYNWAKQVPPPR